MFKKFFLGLICAGISGFAAAQVVEVEGGNEHTWYLDQALSTDCHMPFKNVTGKATVFGYKQVSSDFPSNWFVSFCDNRNCWGTMVLEDSFAEIGAGESSEFKLTIDPDGHADTSRVVYEIYDNHNPGVRDTIIFNFIVQWGAGITENQFNRNAIYPNPASHILNFPLIREKVNVLLFSSDSRLVSTTAVSQVDPRMDISNLKPGLYFISYSQGDKLVRSTFIKE